MDTSAIRSHQRRFRAEDLLYPDAYPHVGEPLSIRETHISWVILTGEWAYKIKKPVKYDFIDASTLERRHFLCKEELRLNRRLAPELYSEVVPIVRRNEKLYIGGEGPIVGPVVGPVVEYAVRMKQFAATDELLEQLRTRSVSVEQITALAELIAAFHASAGVGRPLQSGVGTATFDRWILANLQALAPYRGWFLSPWLERLEAWTHLQLQSLSSLRSRRYDRGQVRECHGDLHAGNIVRFKGRLVPFDCLEFNPELRWTDVIDDVAFLFMDLIAHRRVDLAYAFASRYFEAGGDYEGVRLLIFYAVYRALVRAKVDALAADQSAAQSDTWKARMARRIETALEFTAPLQRGVLVLMHGVSGSGKSWLSERLVQKLPGLRIRSDVERKRCAENWPEGSAVQGLYTKEFTRLVYDRALECAEHCLNSGFTAIVDATFLEASDFGPFKALAARVKSPCVIVSCRAGVDVLKARLSQRTRKKTDASDANVAVLEQQLASLQPLPVDLLPSVIEVDTGRHDAVEFAAKSIQARTR